MRSNQSQQSVFVFLSHEHNHSFSKNLYTMTASTADKASRAIRSNKIRKRRRQEVEVVVAGTGFPISKRSSQSTKHQPSSKAQSYVQPKRQEKSLVLDLNEAKRDVRNYGATAFVGNKKKSFEEEQYKLLTGRDKKKPKIPPNIAREIRKRHAKKEAEAIEEAKKAGFVLPKSDTSKAKKNKDRDTSFSHGPAPSVGFVKNGMLKLSKKPF